ncbi:TIGR03826 family flagellar region protein [Paenibacillus tarimensis]|uniref:TIGR03826 family flagellar region protein n=1 Tax=Paenibacillus tarimensis TaxID=416012 RepID=UPI001F289535|nr:TIGR03826 family flagellar region protein [Paenibacillus tarimensis]MCF2944131.1 flagellar protein [Paenibacillus tarimensis]
MNLGNCPRCGKLYAKNLRDMCPVCIKEVDKQYELCAEYLRKNKGCTIHELSEATEVPMKQITRFIREGRISILNHPNMALACESCGTPIREGNLCMECRHRISRDFREVQKADQSRSASEGTYNTYSIDKQRE